jgi:hypothetical protein
MVMAMITEMKTAGGKARIEGNVRNVSGALPN